MYTLSYLIFLHTYIYTVIYTSIYIYIYIYISPLSTLYVHISTHLSPIPHPSRFGSSVHSVLISQLILGKLIKDKPFKIPGMWTNFEYVIRYILQFLFFIPATQVSSTKLINYMSEQWAQKFHHNNSSPSLSGSSREQMEFSLNRNVTNLARGPLPSCLRDNRSTQGGADYLKPAEALSFQDRWYVCM